MKILFLPNNIGSLTAITVERFNKSGHRAKGLILQGDIKQSHRNLKVLNYKKKSFSGIFTFIKWYILFIKYTLWADVIHWNGSFSFPLLKVTLPVIKFLKKAAVVEFVGSDVRIPEVEFKDNPYYKEVFNNGYEYSYESKTTSEKNQKMFADAGFGIVIGPGMGQYICKDLFRNQTFMMQRFLVDEFTPAYPDPKNKRPVIVHSPTAPFAKGTVYVLKAIENLKAKYEFEFKLIQNLSHIQALEAIRTCDIFIDQLILGGYGTATMEGLAFGKPVICFVKNSVRNDFPDDLPIVNANPDNIFEKLEMLLANPELRFDVGVNSRRYVEKHHNVNNLNMHLLKFYKSLLN